MEPAAAHRQRVGERAQRGTRIDRARARRIHVPHVLDPRLDAPEHRRPWQPDETNLRHLPRDAHDRPRYRQRLDGHRHHEPAVGVGSAAQSVERGEATNAAVSRHLQAGRETTSLSRARHLHTGPRTRIDLRALQRRRHDRHAAVPRARRPRAVFLERIGGDAARAGGLLRSPLQHRLFRPGETGPGQLPGGALMVRRRATRGSALLAVWLVSVSLLGAQQRANFVTCPIVRGTASVPCWLAEYNGELYFLTLQTDVSAPVNPPSLGHRVLVEGTVSTEPRICGGVVLNPVHLSVLERDASCNTMLPAEERYNLTFEPPRPPGPSKGRLAFDNAAPAAPPAPAVTGSTREFVVSYPFDGLIGFTHAGALTAILNFARTASAREIEIVGHRGAVRLSNGQTMVEESNIGKKRAEQIAMLLQGANLKGPSYKVSWREEAAAADGVDDHLSRRVVVTVRR